MSYNPLVTIYIPTKNRLELLKRSIESVLLQTYSNWELIVVNDASTDETKDYLDDLSCKNDKIKTIHHTESKGACISRNEAIFSASGQFITGLDDDDFFTEDRLEKFINNWDESAIALCTYKIITANEKFSQDSNPKLVYINKDDLIYSNLVGNQIFTKTSTLKNIGGFDADFKMWQDYDCWYNLLKNGGQIKKLPIATYVWDHNDRNDRITNQLKNKLLETHSLFTKKYDLTSTQSAILKLNFLDYKIEKNNLLFLIKMAISTFFDKKTIKIILKRKLLSYNFFINFVQKLKSNK